MLINLREMLQIAEKKHSAIGSFNVYNVESLQAVMNASAKASAPVIVSFGESYDSHMPLEGMAELVKLYAAASEVPIVLHLDHSKKMTTILRALKAGFTSIMYDGSAFPLAENIERSRHVAKIAHALNASLEGELGYMNPEDGTPSNMGGVESYTRADDAKRYAEESGADALAIAIGNAHGIYKGKPHLDLGRLSEIHQAVSLPLVLHGSSGIPEELLQAAIRGGIRKININTEVSTTGIRAAKEFLSSHQDPNTRFEAMTKEAEGQMTVVVENYIACFRQEN
ncbi:MAG: class II fructose-bisphosphate aldolase [Selenomonadaceae bacterium]|nr:class II fructose-bisphosphate aldolase [Selenomonadaceae bacterium]MBQ3971201.1 class II fructose-bisphosphate aldolase [Selenomonadaceae bacterium]